MRKLILVLSVLFVFVHSTEAQKKKKNKKNTPETELSSPALLNAVDSMSYAFGVGLGENFAANLQGFPGGEINRDLLIQAFSTVLKGDSAVMTSDFANEYFGNYITKMQEAETAALKQEGEEFLSNNKTKPGILTTESGLQYEVILPGSGAQPLATDLVKVHYEGFLLDGTKFDSSLDRGEPIVFPLNQVIPGWTEGVQLMSPSAKYKFYIPYNLAYGEKGAGEVIPPYSTLIFEVELLEVNPAEEE